MPFLRNTIKFAHCNKTVDNIFLCVNVRCICMANVILN